MVPTIIQEIQWILKHITIENINKCKEEEKYFTKLVKTNQKYLDKMLENNMRYYSVSRTEEDIEDYKQIIMIILWNCINKYDEMKGYTFNTYFGTAVRYEFRKIKREQNKETKNISDLPIEEYSEVLPDNIGIDLTSATQRNKIRTASAAEAHDFLERYNAQIALKKALRKKTTRKVKPFEQLSARQQRRRKKS